MKPKPTSERNYRPMYMCISKIFKFISKIFWLVYNLILLHRKLQTGLQCLVYFPLKLVFGDDFTPKMYRSSGVRGLIPVKLILSHVA